MRNVFPGFDASYHATCNVLGNSQGSTLARHMRPSRSSQPGESEREAANSTSGSEICGLASRICRRLKIVGELRRC